MRLYREILTFSVKENASKRKKGAAPVSSKKSMVKLRNTVHNKGVKGSARGEPPPAKFPRLSGGLVPLRGRSEEGQVRPGAPRSGAALLFSCLKV